MASKEPQLSAESQFLRASIEKKSVWVLQALNDLIDIDWRDEIHQAVPASLRAKDRQLTKRLGLDSFHYRKIEVVFYHIRLCHQRPEFGCYDSSGNKTRWLLYKYGSIVLKDDFLASLRETSGLNLQHSNRWGNFEQVMNDYSNFAPLTRPQTLSLKRKAPVQVHSKGKRNRKDLVQRLLAARPAGTETIRQANGAYPAASSNKDGMSSFEAISAVPVMRSNSSKDSVSTKRPILKTWQNPLDISTGEDMNQYAGNSKRSQSAPRYSTFSSGDEEDDQSRITEVYSNTEVCRPSPLHYSTTHSRLHVPYNEDPAATNLRQVIRQYLLHNDVMYGLENGAVLNTMNDIKEECEQAITSFFDRRGELDPSHVIEIESHKDISIVFFGHSGQCIWSDSGPAIPDPCTTGLKVIDAFRSCLQAFILKDVFKSSFPSFLYPRDEASQKLLDSLQNTPGKHKQSHISPGTNRLPLDLYKFYHFITHRAWTSVLQDQWFQKKTKDIARELAIKFCQMIEGLFPQSRGFESYLVSTNKDWDSLLKDELESIFSRCLTMRAKIALDEDKREVTFELPRPGQGFDSTGMEHNDQKVDRGGKVGLTALGPKISARNVLAHQAGARTSTGAPIIIRKATVLLYGQ
ncbi:hypothetical protein MMC17_008601 [Xylographa soralifera]|nr:hypothetical protein [Xylographa soralifera]